VKLTTHLHLVPGQEWLELYFHSSNTLSWRGVQLKHRDKLNNHFGYDILHINLYY
jgi:hypothetical protein